MPYDPNWAKVDANAVPHVVVPPDDYGLTREQLIPEIDEVRGLPAFLLEDLATADKVLTF